MQDHENSSNKGKEDTALETLGKAATAAWAPGHRDPCARQAAEP